MATQHFMSRERWLLVPFGGGLPQAFFNPKKASEVAAAIQHCTVTKQVQDENGKWVTAGVNTAVA